MAASRSTNVASITKTSASRACSANPLVVSASPKITSFLRPFWRPEDVLGIDHPTVRERHRPSFRQLLANWAVRHSESREADGEKMTADLAFEGESEAVGVAVADRKAADRERASVEDLTFRQGHELQWN